MRRPIDATALYKEFREELKKHPMPETPGLGRYRAQVWLEAAGFFITMLTKAPTVDAVEVVRCKDCRYCIKHPTSDNAKLCTNKKWNREYHPLVEDNDFCSYGERRAERVPVKRK